LRHVVLPKKLSMNRYRLIWATSGRVVLGQADFPEQGTLRIGRASTNEASIPDDKLISRQHAVAEIQGDKFFIRCLEGAANGLLHAGKRLREVRLAVGESFRIGGTEFLCLDQDEGSQGSPSKVRDIDDQFGDPTEAPRVRESAYSAEALQKAEFRNPIHQIEILANLPEQIASTRSDEEFAVKVAELLLEGIPHADAVAVVRFVESDLVWTPGLCSQPPAPALVRVASRESYSGRFRPSRRLMLKSLQLGQSVIHIVEPEEVSAQFTISDGLGWSFSCPIRGAVCSGWCLFVSGRRYLQGDVFGEEALQGDLRFTELLAQFIGSIRQVRTLQNQQTQLSTFFSPKVIESLMSTKSVNADMAPAECDVTVLFCDLRGFSERSEALQHDLPALFQSVSRALGVMANGVLEQNGAIADFQGDAIHGFWGWPIHDANGPWPACRAALAIDEGFRSAKEEVNSLLTGLSAGIGIAHGRALAGRIGTEQQAKIGVFGPVVNQGSRLEGMTKHFGVSICIDQAVAEYLREHIPATEARTRFLSTVRPKGMRTPISVYELLPGETSASAVSSELIAAHESAVHEVIAGHWEEVRGNLHKLPEEDGPANFLRAFLAKAPNVPGSDWDGVIRLEHK
jgi:adenylate cyclase